MKRLILLSLLFLIPSSVLAVEISVGTTNLSIPSPVGYSLITSDMQPYVKLTERFVPPMNEQFAKFLPEADAAIAARGEIPQSHRHFSVQTAKALIQPFISNNDFAQFKRKIKTQNEDIFKKAELQMPDWLEKINKGIAMDYNVDLGISIDRPLPLPSHSETERSLAYSTFVKYKINDEEGKPSFFEGIVTATLVHVQGKVLFLYVNAEKSGLDWCRTESSKWADAVIAANPSTGDIAARESKHSQGDFDWDKIFVKGTLGAIMGGILGIIGYLSKRRNVPGKEQKKGKIDGKSSDRKEERLCVCGNCEYLISKNSDGFCPECGHRLEE
jgi:RNA polymerase subunit RPABC4/transcription elongation factor Spt4